MDALLELLKKNARESDATLAKLLGISEQEVRALLPRYTGVIMQTPPQFSAIKIDGQRLSQKACSALGADNAVLEQERAKA